MKLIIDIPEGLKKDFELEQWTALSCMEMKNALEKTIPLDNIRAEIVEMRSKQNVGVLECLDIIDKYRSESDCRECKAEHDCYECEKYTESEES